MYRIKYSWTNLLFGTALLSSMTSIGLYLYKRFFTKTKVITDNNDQTQ